MWGCIPTDIQKWRYVIRKNGEVIKEGETDDDFGLVCEVTYEYLDVDDVRFDTDDRTGTALICGIHGVGCCDWGWGIDEEEWETYCEGTCTWSYYYVKDKKTGDELAFEFKKIEQDEQWPAHEDKEAMENEYD